MFEPVESSSGGGTSSMFGSRARVSLFSLSSDESATPTAAVAPQSAILPGQPEGHSQSSTPRQVYIEEEDLGSCRSDLCPPSFMMEKAWEAQCSAGGVVGVSTTEVPIAPDIPARLQYFSISVGPGMTRSKFCLPSVHHVQALVTAMASQCDPKETDNSIDYSQTATGAPSSVLGAQFVGDAKRMSDPTTRSVAVLAVIIAIWLLYLSVIYFCHDHRQISRASICHRPCQSHSECSRDVSGEVALFWMFLGHSSRSQASIHH